MAVPFFTIPAVQLQGVQDAFDTWITTAGKPCKLFFTPTTIACANCVSDAIGHKTSNRWRSGGPAPFDLGTLCPVCGGTNQLTTENSKTITMNCSFRIAEWASSKGVGPRSPTNIRIPDGMAITRGFLTDMPAIMQAKYAILNCNIEPYLHYRYVLDSELNDPNKIVQNRYFKCMWRRSG